MAVQNIFRSLLLTAMTAHYVIGIFRCGNLGPFSFFTQIANNRNVERKVVVAVSESFL